jgi:hypothetical protein
MDVYLRDTWGKGPYGLKVSNDKDIGHKDPTDGKETSV